jgi:hypothetical protein
MLDCLPVKILLPRPYTEEARRDEYWDQKLCMLEIPYNPQRLLPKRRRLKPPDCLYLHTDYLGEDGEYEIGRFADHAFEIQYYPRYSTGFFIFMQSFVKNSVQDNEMSFANT